MNPDRSEWEAIKEITASALELPASEREAFVRERSGSNATIAEAVLAMLASEDDTGDVLRGDIDLVVGASALPIATGATEFDGFRIERLIARGGTSDVYLAHQSHPERQVAIKVFRAGLGSDRQVERFRGEVRILAKLDHPNIASIFSAGFSDKVAPVPLPYLAMEYVEGQTLTEYVRSREFSVDDRLRLMAKVCSAVHGAHQRGVIHRDLKPANILIRADGEPKVLDFGIARLVTTDGSSSRSHTMTGELMGTLAYMSPEQLRADHDAIDIRTDVYALGVILYEVLADKPAFDVSALPIPEAINRIQRGVRLSLREAGVQCDPDIEAVIQKASAATPSERYGSAEALAEDLRHVLAGEPVLAQPPTTLYRLRKFAGRNKAGVATALVLTVVILGLSLASVVGFIRASHQRNLALAAKTDAENALAREELVGSYVRSMLTSADPTIHGPDVRVVDVLRLWGDDIDKDLASNPEVGSRLHGLLADTYFALGSYDDATEHYRAAISGVTPLEGVDSSTRLDMSTGLANTLMYLDQLEEAETLITENLERAIRLDGAESLEALRLRESKAALARLRNEIEQAEELYGSLRDDAKRLFGEESEICTAALSGLSRTYLESYQPAKAIEVLRELLDIRTRVDGPDDPGAIIARGNLGIALEDLGEYQQSVDLLTENVRIGEEKLGPLHHTVRSSRGALAISLHSLGKTDEAIELSERVLRDEIEIYGPDHTDVATATSNLVAMLLSEERYEEALRYTPMALEILSKAYGPDHLRTISALGNHAVTLQGLKQYDKAGEVLGDLYERLKRAAGPANTQTLIWGNNLAMLRHETEDFAGGAAVLSEVLTQALASEECPDVYIAIFERNLGRCLIGKGDYPGAYEHLNESMRLLEGAPEHMIARTQEFLDELAGLWTPPG